MNPQNNPLTSPTSHLSADHRLAFSEVRTRSQQWIADFNRGDVAACVAAYAPDAIMAVKPTGTFTGIDEIAGFWRSLVASGAGELEYTNTELDVVDRRTVVLTADWSMNAGHGVITEERWVKQDDGRWLLERDAFEIRD